MRIYDISILGWIHTVACLIALPAGLAIFAMTKGNARHRRLGRWYLVSMLIGTLTAFGLYAPIKGIEPGFNVFHWLSLVTLVALAVAYVGARRQAKAPWAYAHPAGMIVSYYMLIGALLNEAFSRAAALQAYAGTPVAGMAQGTLMMAFLAILAFSLARIAVRRARLRARVPA